MTRATQLKSAMRSGSLVRFNRPFEESPAEGYVVAVGPDFFLLALVSDPDVCQIGRVMSVAATTLSLLEIDPGAVWDEAPTRYALKQITRVDFGGDYEEALHLVGGDPNAG